MTESTLSASSISAEAAQPQSGNAPAPAATCDECLGSGGWFRYEPALEPAPGVLYLSCLQCRGTGRTAQPLRG
jgi:hypothetical protein